MKENDEFVEKTLNDIKEHEEIYERALTAIRKGYSELRKYYIDCIIDAVIETGTVSDGWWRLQIPGFKLEYTYAGNGQTIMITEIRVNLVTYEGEYDYVYSHNGYRGIPNDRTVPLSKINADWEKMKELFEYIKDLNKSNEIEQA